MSSFLSASIAECSKRQKYISTAYFFTLFQEDLELFCHLVFKSSESFPVLPCPCNVELSLCTLTTSQIRKNCLSKLQCVFHIRPFGRMFTKDNLVQNIISLDDKC